MTLRQRQPRVENPAFLAFVRCQPCCACGKFPPSQAAHVRYSDAFSGNINPGAGAKPDDAKCVPLCQMCHVGPGGQHTMGEQQFWAKVGVDPFKLASDLYSRFTEAPPETATKAPRHRQKRASIRGAKVRGPKRKWPSRKIAQRRKT